MSCFSAMPASARARALCGSICEADLVDVDDGVVDAAEGDVGLEGAPGRRLDPAVQRLGEAGNVVEADLEAAAVRAAGARDDEAGGGIEAHDGLRLAHRDPAGLQQRGHHADAVAARHGVRAVGLQHHEAGVGAGPRRRQQQVQRHLRTGARLQRHEAAQAVVDRVDVVHLVEHGRARNLRRAADDHLADLALAVDLDDVERVWPRHIGLRLRPGLNGALVAAQTGCAAPRRRRAVAQAAIGEAA